MEANNIKVLLFQSSGVTKKEGKVSLRTKAAKFKVYVFRTQAQRLAGIITARSSVTVTPALVNLRQGHAQTRTVRAHPWSRTSNLHSYCYINCMLANTISCIL